MDTEVSNKQKESGTLASNNIFIDLWEYIRIRSRQVYIWTALFFEFGFIVSSNLKKEIIRRMFWGRNSFYRKAFHSLMFTLTISLLLNGLSQRINIRNNEASTGLNAASESITEQDMFLQYSHTKSITLKEKDEIFSIFTHTVEKGQTLDDIAKLYKFDDTTSIIWANNLDPYNPKIYPGKPLKIPPMKGVLKTVKAGDTVKSITNNVKNANIIDVLELNDLKSPDDILEPGRAIFIPNGDIPLPKPGSGNVNTKTPVLVELPKTGVTVPDGTFVNPLGDSSCDGYGMSRGWTSYHTGMDLAKDGGCWIRSIAAGTVSRARWCEGGLGFCVVIKHADGYTSLYAHGNGTFAVQEGDSVKAGQNIMFMGNTGFSFGTHLHLSVAADNNDIMPHGNRININNVVPH